MSQDNQDNLDSDDLDLDHRGDFDAPDLGFQNVFDSEPDLESDEPFEPDESRSDRKEVKPDDLEMALQSILTAMEAVGDRIDALNKNFGAALASVVNEMAALRGKVSDLHYAAESQPTKGRPVPLSLKIASLLGVSGTAVASLITAVILMLVGWFTPQVKFDPNIHIPGVIINQVDPAAANGNDLQKANADLLEKLRKGKGK